MKALAAWNLIDKVRWLHLSTGHILEPAEVVLTISTAYDSPGIALIAKRIPETDSACKTTSKTKLNQKFLRTFIFAQISLAPL